MKPFFFSFILTCLLSVIGCHSSSYQELPENSVLEQLLESNPDSLATLLEEDIDPFLLSDTERADYGWWLTNTHRKQHRNLINDTLIFYTLDFYKTIGSPRLLKTYLLAADQVNSSGLHVLEKRKILEKALELSQTKNDSIMVKEIIARLVETFDVGENQDKLKELIGLTKKYSKKEADIHSLLSGFRIDFKALMIDSVGVYSQMGMKLTSEQEPSYFDYYFSREYSKYLNFKGKSREAIHVLNELGSRMETGNELHLDYIVNWIEANRFDSAQVHMDYLQALIDNHKYDAVDETYLVDIMLSSLRTAIKAKKGEIVSMYDWGTSPDRLLGYSRTMISADRERQFIQNKLFKDKLMLEIERGKLRQRSLGGGIILLILVASMIVIYQRKLLKKERIVQQSKEQLRLRSIQLSENEAVISKNEELIKELSGQLDESGDLQQEIDQLVEGNKVLDQKNRLLQKDIEHFSKSITRKDEELSLYEQLVEQSARLQERERFLTVQLIALTPVLDKLSKKPRYIEEAQWAEVLQAVNLLFDGFTYRLHTSFSSLSDEDIRYCGLIKLRLSTSVISTLTGISPSSVTKRKQRIKEKMNQQRPADISKDESLEIYLWNY